jgi:hypothetical protein
MQAKKMFAGLLMACAGGLCAFTPAGNPAQTGPVSFTAGTQAQTGAIVIDKNYTRDINSRLIDYVDHSYILEKVYWVPENAANGHTRSEMVEAIVSKY